MKKSNLRRKINKINKTKKNVHKQLIDDLEKRLEESGDYYYIGREIEYRHPLTKQVIGECDLYALKMSATGKFYALFFEVKSTDTQRNRKKAYKQLIRDESVLMNNYHRGFKFYVTPKMIKWYKKKN